MKWGWGQSCNGEGDGSCLCGDGWGLGQGLAGTVGDGFQVHGRSPLNQGSFGCAVFCVV